jgi:hypothetical protein
VNPNRSKAQVLKFAPASEIQSAEHIVEFVDEYLAGKLISILKSHPNPLSPSPLLISAYNTDTFQALMASNYSSVLVYFDGPGCFDCVHIWPVFEQAVRAVKPLS